MKNRIKLFLESLDRIELFWSFLGGFCFTVFVRVLEQGSPDNSFRWGYDIFRMRKWVDTYGPGFEIEGNLENFVFGFVVTLLLIYTIKLYNKEVSCLQERNGIKYEPNSEVPFTGVFIERFDNGQKELEEYYKNGKWDGLETQWYENGQKRSEGNFKENEKEGVWTNWDKDGNISSTIKYEEGVEVQ